MTRHLLVIFSIVMVGNAGHAGSFQPAQRASANSCTYAYARPNALITIATESETGLIQEFILAQREALGFDPAKGIDGRSLLNDLNNFSRSYGGLNGQIYLLKSPSIVGTAALSRVDASTVEIKKVYLEASLRGQGAGRRLVQFVLERAREQGYRYVILQTRAEMQAAVRLYESLGFTRDEIRSSGGVLAYHLKLDPL